MDMLAINTHDLLSMKNIYLLCLYGGLVYSVVVYVFGDLLHVFDSLPGHLEGLTALETTFSPFHPLVIAAFLVSFGASGTVLQAFYTSQIFILAVSLFMAFLLAIVFFYGIVKLLLDNQVSSTLDMGNAHGLQAVVTLTIPAEGVGEVAYTAKYRRYVSPARSFHKQELLQGDKVMIMDRAGNEVYVIKI